MYQPSNILKAWTLLVRDNDPTASAAAEQIRQMAANELLHAWLEGWIAPVDQALPQAKPVESEVKPVVKAPIKSIKPGKPIPGLVKAYKSAPVIINGLLARDLMNQLAVEKATSVTNLLNSCGFKNGLGSLKSSVEKERVCTHWGGWMAELLGPSILIKEETHSI